MIRNLFDICSRVVLTAAVMLAGCSDDVPGDEQLSPQPEEVAGNVYIRFHMSMAECGNPGSRAAVDDGTPGTSCESALNTVDLFVYDATSKILTDIVSLDRKQIDIISDSEGDGLIVPLSAGAGQTLIICAVANLPVRIREKFLIGQTRSDMIISSNGGDYWDVIDEFVPGSLGSQEKLQAAGSFVPMAGRFVPEDGTDVIEVAGHTTPLDALPLTAALSRIVAKAHVLAYAQRHPVSSGGYVMYVNAEDKTGTAEETSGGDYANWMGWIRLDNVRYILNGTNKSTYLFPQPTGNATYPQYRDPNMDLDIYVAGGMDIGMGFDAPAWASEYAYYNGLALHRENIAADSHMEQAEAYEDRKHQNTVDGIDTEERYTRGLYCLENYFDRPVDNAASFASYEEAIPMVTHVSIAAKLTPRWLVIMEDYEATMDGFVDEYVLNKEKFCKKYGLTDKDFTDDDVQRWKDMKVRYSDYLTGDTYKYRSAFRLIKTVSEADATDIINWSLMSRHLWSGDAADFERGLYPSGTFYVYDMKYDAVQSTHTGIDWHQSYLYLTAGAVALATDDDIDIKTYSVPHIGGWGYYFTYIDQTKATVNGKTPYEASQVTRNTYYLVTVGNFGVPGGSVTRPEFIKVNTEPVDWQYAGKGNITLH